MQKYNGALLRKFDDPVQGNASVGTSVVVRKKSDNSIAPIYSVDDINSIQKPNPFTTDAFGRYSFFAPNGKYIIQFGDGSDEIEISMVDNLYHNSLSGRNAAGAHSASAISNANGGSVQDFIDKTEPSIYVSIKSLPSYSDVDAVPAMLESKALYDYIYFSGGEGGEVIYNIVGDQPLLYGATLIVDKNVVLSFDYDYYAFQGSLNIIGDCVCRIATKQFDMRSIKINQYRTEIGINNMPQTIEPIAFSDCKVMDIDGDVYTTRSIVNSSDSAVIFETYPSKISALFAPIAIGETISAHMSMDTGTTASLGFILRCSNGWIKIFQQLASSGAWEWKVKKIGGAIVTNVNVNTPDNTLLSYRADRASFGIALESSTKFSVIINGCSGTAPLISTVGEIYEIGFMSEGHSSGAVARVTGLCAYKSESGVYGKVPLNIKCYGDSTIETWISSFDRYLRQALDGVNGCRTLEIVNRAIAGQTFRQQLDLLKSDGVGSSYLIIMGALTNEIQGGAVSADDAAAMVQEFLDYCASYGRIGMIVEPYMWYPSSAIGGKGQSSANYENGAKIREATKRVALLNGAPCVSTTHSLPAPLPSYFNSGIAALLRDDIHQDLLGYQLYAKNIASEVARWWFGVDKTARSIPSYLAGAGVSLSDTALDEKSLVATLTVTGFANSQVVLNLPRWARPDRQMSWPATFLKVGGTYGGCRVLYQSGQLKIDGLDTSESVIILNLSW